MTQTEHLQKVILLIAKDIDKLCRKNGIKYYLLGGSCIGAIRHHGFIPWDDDLDIIMDRQNYNRFIEVCREKLDKDKYVLQIGLQDWPLYFTKIRLKNTTLHEPEDGYASDDMHGIYLDVFAMDNVPENNITARIQYFLAKYHLCYQLGKRTYKDTTLKKKMMIALSAPLGIKPIRTAVLRFIERFNRSSTSRQAFYYGRTRFRNAIVKKSIFGEPKYVDFEDTQLPVPEHYHEYLTQMFGDYMKLPPMEQRKGLHLISVDFGEY